MSTTLEGTGVPVLEGAPASRLIGWRARLDTPWLPAIAILLAGVAVVWSRLAVVAHGDVSVFILPGLDLTQPALLPRGVHAFPHAGYDGQFFYRLATDPFALRGRVHGILFDTPYRPQRIGYPFLAWLFALGHVRWVAWSMIYTNLLCLGGLGFLGGVLARDAERHATWGLLLAGYWGYMFSISRDVAEVPAALWLVAGLLALRRSRPVLAGLCLAASVLTRETAMVAVAAVALVGLRDGWRRWRAADHAGGAGVRGWLPAQLGWAIPTVAFVAWQLTIRRLFGTLAARTDAGANLAAPLVAALKAVHHDLLSLDQLESRLGLGEISALFVITVLALWLGRGSTAPPAEKLAWLLLGGLVVCLSATVWSGFASLRSMDQLFLFDVVVLFGSRLRRALWVPAVLTAGSWLVVVIHQIRVI